MKIFGITFGRSDPAPVRKAMELHRKMFPFCECGCGLAPVDIHHIIPVSVDPSKAADPRNLISLHEECHIAHGHAGDKSCRHYVPNIRESLNTRIVRNI
jgi:5-methylcytosine-specific restriction endonuclease McrA